MKALTIGGAMIDTIAIIESDRIERMSMLNAESSFLLLEEGRKTEALEVSTHCGGGAANAAVALARLGFDVAALVKLGRDERADLILARLKQEGIGTPWVVPDARAPTGASVLVSSHERNAAVFTFRGANTLLEPGDLAEAAFAVDLVYVANLSNQSADCYPGIIDLAKAHGAMIAVNPGVRQLSAHGAAFHAHLPSLDILALNRKEADALVTALVPKFGEGGTALPFAPGDSPPRLAVRGLVGGGFEMGLRTFLGALLRLGPRHVLLTDGSAGAFAATNARIYYCPAAEAVVAGTAGAGDAFATTYAAFVADGQKPETALRAASLNAAAVLAHVDTQTGLMQRKELETEIGKSTERLNVMSWPL
jgi:ribokinase